MHVHPQVAGRAFLSLVTAPEGFSREDTARLIAQSTGLDERTLRMRLGLVPPLVVGLVEDAHAQHGTQAIKSAGGDAFAPTMQDIQALGPTLKVRDMELRDGLVHIELWRGPALRVPPRDIEILVRAQTPGSAGDPVPYAPAPLPIAHHVGLGGMGQGNGAALAVMLGIGGAYGLAAMMHPLDKFNDSGAIGALPAVNAPQQLPSHKLDLHTHDGRVLQVDGDKFGYRILGEMRGHSDSVNIARMAELFIHLNPDVVVDTYFNAFLPPTGHQRLRLPLMKINNDHIAFAFYSRWCALMYRHVMGKS